MVGVLHSRLGVPHPRGYPSQVLMVGGTPSQVRGYTIPGWGYPGQVLMVRGNPFQVGGTPSQGGGTPARSWWWGYPGYPTHHPDLARGTLGTPHHEDLAGYPPPSRLGWGTPHPWDGIPPTIQIWMGYPPCQTWDGVTPHQELAGVPPHPKPEMGYPPIIQTWMGYPLLPPHRNVNRQAPVKTVLSLVLRTRAVTTTKLLFVWIWWESQSQYRILNARLCDLTLYPSCGTKYQRVKCFCNDVKVPAFKCFSSYRRRCYWDQQLNIT